MAVRADDLLALGVPDHRPAVLPGLLADLLYRDDWLRVGAAGGMPRETHERLRAVLPAFEDWCGWLAGLGVEPSVQHDDLHDGNVFADGYRVFDWGDASVAQPFGTLLVTLRSVAASFGLPADDRRLDRLRDAYLEPWTDRWSWAELVEAARLAARVSTVSRALAWRRALADTPAPERGEYAEAVPGWLGELLEPVPA